MQLTSKVLLQETKAPHFCEVLVYENNAALVFEGDRVNILGYSITDPSKLLMFCRWKNIAAQDLRTKLSPGMYKIRGTGEVSGPSSVAAAHLRAQAEEHGWATWYVGQGYNRMQIVVVD